MPHIQRTTFMRHRVESTFLQHSYTLTPRVSGDRNTQGEREYTWPSTGALTEQACEYSPVQTLDMSEVGQVVVSTPSILVSAGSNLARGDRVSNVRDRDGLLIIAGPLEVEDWTPDVSSGGTVVKRAMLRGGAVLS